MQPLTPDDLLSLEEFAARRGEFFAAHQRYLDRYRRVRVGPCLTLLFENRQTLWFRVQELLRIARLADPERVRGELDWYNRLLPGRGRLQAAVLVAPDPAQPNEVDALGWPARAAESLRLRLGHDTLPGTLVTCRPEDRCVGMAHWAEFALDARARRALGDRHVPARFEAEAPAYTHASPWLSDEVRQSLLDDLTLSDRAAG